MVVKSEQNVLPGVSFWRARYTCALMYNIVHNPPPVCGVGGTFQAQWSGTLQELHWLPIAQRIAYKLCLLVYKSRTGRAPVYVSDMLTPAADVTSRAMRSSTNYDYFVRRTTLRLGDRAFSVAAPRAWNQLPSELKTTTCSNETSKKRLKTFFYLILLLVLIRRDNVMRHRSVCRGRTTCPCCNCNCKWNTGYSLHIVSAFWISRYVRYHTASAALTIVMMWASPGNRMQLLLWFIFSPKVR